MVTRIGKKRRLHLYIQEWMENRGLSDEQLGLRMGVARATVWRWRSEQHRLNPEKIEALARALDLEPQDLWRPPSEPILPGRPSLDEMIKDAPEDLQNTATDIVRRLVSR